MDESAEPHVCETCLKSYQRRDLLLRHRRRCLRPSKPIIRRKACDTCVKAKAKCCYSQPRCSRCTKRNIYCRYVLSDSAAERALNLGNNDDMAHKGSPEASHGEASEKSALTSVTETFDLPDLLSPSGSLWFLENFDIPMQSTIPITGLPATDAVLNTQSTGAPQEGILSPSQVFSSLPENMNQTTPASDISELELSLPTASPPLGVGTSLESASITDDVSYNPNKVEHLLGQYPQMLLREDFASPFLHWTLYQDLVPDMSTLPRTSMAICCSSGINFEHSARFVKRAMDAERQSLIEKYVREI